MLTPHNGIVPICLCAALLLPATCAYSIISPTSQSFGHQQQRGIIAKPKYSRNLHHASPEPPVIPSPDDARFIDHTTDGPLPASHPRYFPLSPLSTHLDARFARSAPPPTLERQAALSRLLHSFISTMNDLGITVWLAHGSLLAWYWSERVFPWEWDLDVHVHFRELERLASCCNGSAYKYGAGERYLLDINAFMWERDGKIDPANRIDARWVDLATGMFVDVTAVEREDKRRGGLGAKDGHWYRTKDVLPLKVAWFEGVEVLVPWNTTAVLEQEYGRKVLVMRVFRG